MAHCFGVNDSTSCSSEKNQPHRMEELVTSLINHFFPGDALDISEISMKTKASPPRKEGWMQFAPGCEIAARQSRVRGSVTCEPVLFHFVLTVEGPGDYIFITVCLTLTSSIKQVCVSVGTYPGM